MMEKEVDHTNGKYGYIYIAEEGQEAKSKLLLRSQSSPLAVAALLLGNQFTEKEDKTNDDSIWNTATSRSNRAQSVSYSLVVEKPPHRTLSKVLSLRIMKSITADNNRIIRRGSSSFNLANFQHDEEDHSHTKEEHHTDSQPQEQQVDSHPQMIDKPSEIQETTNLLFPSQLSTPQKAEVSVEQSSTENLIPELDIEVTEGIDTDRGESSMTDVTNLTKIFEEEREKHHRTKSKLKEAKHKAREASSTMSTLLQQISQYKRALESERNQLKEELDQVEQAYTQLREANNKLRKQRDDITSEKEEYLEQQKEFQIEYEDTLRQQKTTIQTLKLENTRNLESLFKDLELLEELNEQLTTDFESVCNQIKQERDNHSKSLQELILLKEANKEREATIESIRVTNTALVIQIKELQSQPPLPEEPTQQQGIPSISPLTSPVVPAPEPAMPVQPMSPSSSSEKDQDSLFEVLQVLPEAPGSVRVLIRVEDTVWCGCGDGTIRVMGLINYQLIEDRKHHTASIFDLKLVREKFVWSCSKDKSVCVWATNKSIPVKVIKDCGFCTTLLEVDGNRKPHTTDCSDYVWCGTIDGEIKAYDNKNFRQHQVLKSKSEAIGCMLKRANRVWAGCEKDIVIWNSTTFKATKTLEGHKRTINQLCAVGPYEVWSCSSDKTIRCWNAETHQAIKVLELDSRVFCLHEMRSTGLIWAGVWDLAILLFNAKTYELVSRVKTPHRDATSGLLSDDNGNLWCGSWDSKISIWGQKLLQQTTTTTTRTRAATANPDTIGQRAYTFLSDLLKHPT